jgi:hypothetical protein
MELVVCTSPEECTNFRGRHLQLCEEQAHPSISETARISKVGWAYANLVVTKLKAIRIIVDPELLRRKQLNVLWPGQTLSTVHEMFLLALRTVNLAQLCTRVGYPLGQSGILPVHS